MSEAPCGVALFSSLPFYASPSVFVNDALASPEAHVTAARGTKHLVFNSPQSRKNFTPLLWPENKNPKNILVGSPLAPTTLRLNNPLGTKGRFFISSW
jgi:hypothetical protein